MRQLAKDSVCSVESFFTFPSMTNHIICIPKPGGDLAPSQFRTSGLAHPKSVLCPFAVMGLVRQPSGCCHFGADGLVSLLERFTPKLAERLTHRMVPREAQHFAVELAEALGKYLDRDDRNVAGIETLSHGMYWFLLVSAMGYGTEAVSTRES